MSVSFGSFPGSDPCGLSAPKALSLRLELKGLRRLAPEEGTYR